MVTTSIQQVGNRYRVKFIGQSLRNGHLTEGYFTREELDELRVAIEHAQEQIQRLDERSKKPEDMGAMFARLHEQLRRMTPVPD